ncbi:MAG: tRNA (adenosine(37)-N6)-dimethylallyltransferase MiaA [Puniceicoccales bacterium]|jgi:tRNA dimethylallyltransferase|nr:tRNA (adenosine(37)-N6)-dimethylallyltransferase MiaA [Puniceicoccales bacterium]
MPPAQPSLLIITGATASGKTDFALAWARAHNAEIVSCDSLLVYRGMDIGTAKPGANVRAAVAHHCLDLVEPDDVFSVAEYVRAASGAIRDIAARGRKIVVCGGSGFYLQAFYRAVAGSTPVPAAVEAQVRALAAEGLPALVEALLPFAPEKPAFLDWQNPRRVAKALERCLAGRRPLAELYAEFLSARGPFDAFPKRTLLLERAPAELEARIKQRTQAMLRAGLVDEVRTLRDTGKLRPGTPASSSIGYRETLAWLETERGGLTALAEAITIATRQLAAKQRKWFRTQIPVDETLHPPQLWD